VNVVDDWKATMMANSAKDPYWRAKVSHEILINPGHATELEDKCTTCHAPMGHYQSKFEGDPHYGIADLVNDTLGLDGVSCAACHQQSAEDLGLLFSGEIKFDTSRVIYGPYEMPFMGPMSSFVGFTPVYSEHINDAGICAGCHTLVTETSDLNGNPTGQTFVEQATYHEWLNSAYNGEKVGVSCQECHMPRIDDGVVISSNYLFLQPRSPFGQHTLVGANTMMLQLMKDNKDALGLFATDANFDSTLASTYDLLQHQTLDLDVQFQEIENDTAFFQMDLVNLAGHKFPSGYPARRAFIEFLVVDSNQDTLFHTGRMDENWEILDQDPGFEPHHAVIRSEDQVQIYEIINADVNGDYTTVLERAASALKDNRLTPLGFSTQHSTYDTTAIIGNASTDPNFNFANGVEGSGSDRIFFEIPLNGYTGMIDVKARVWYQSLSPRFLAPMFTQNSTAINTFKSMFDNADNSPVLVSEELIDGIVVTNVESPEIAENDLQVYPNPVMQDGWVRIDQSKTPIQLIRIFNGAGQLIDQFDHVQMPFSFRLPATSGLYIIEAIDVNNHRISKKILRQP
ncbi:MAG: T9SS type A sorting domain-containing protein, partial [Bacteroidota bacterium]